MARLDFRNGKGAAWGELAMGRENDGCYVLLEEEGLQDRVFCCSTTEQGSKRRAPARLRFFPFLLAHHPSQTKFRKLGKIQRSTFTVKSRFFPYLRCI